MNQTIYKFFSILLIVTVLSTSFISTNKVEAAPVDDIAARCATRFVEQEIKAWVTGSAAAAAVALVQSFNVAIAVPTGSAGSASGAIYQAGQGTKLSAQQYIKQAADCVISALSQIMIDEMNQKTAEWIKQGLNGSPLYTPNLQKLLTNLAQMPANELKKQIDGFLLCDFDGADTFKARLGNSVALSTRENSRPKFKEQVKCPFPTTQGNRAQDFYGGAFTWAGFESSLQDTGNPFGISYQMSKELSVRTEEILAVKKQELAQSDGFSGVVDTTNCSYPTADYMAFLEANADAEAITNAQRQYCKTTTPGKTVSEKLTDAVKSDMKKLINQDSLTKLIEGFITKQLNDAINGILK